MRVPSGKLALCVLLIFCVYLMARDVVDNKARRTAKRAMEMAGMREEQTIGDVRFLVVDEDYLRRIQGDPDAKPYGNLEVSAPSSSFDSLDEEDFPDLNILYTHEYPPDKDYVLFQGLHGEAVQRAVLKFDTIPHGILETPKDVQGFLRGWNRSELLECQNIDMKRPARARRLDLKFIEELAKLRDYIISFDMNPFICAGTLLGWYRECTIIPSTNDMDISILVEEFNQAMIDELLTQEKFYLHKKLGYVNDSFELTIAPPGGYIDVFFVYSEADYSWVGGLESSTREKYKFIYPKYTSFCAADLLNHLFYVPCNVEEVLTADYGNWKEDHPHERYVWFASGKNVQKNGFWSPEDMKYVNNYYHSPYVDGKTVAIG